MMEPTRIRRPPVGIAHRVVIVAGDRRIQATHTVKVPAGEESRWTRILHLDEPLNVQTVDIIFEPDPSLAYETVETFDMWNRVIVVKDVPVRERWRPPAR